VLQTLDFSNTGRWARSQNPVILSVIRLVLESSDIGFYGHQGEKGREKIKENRLMKCSI
jgi:hypothetical protein